MASQRIHRKVERGAAEKERIRAARVQFQREKPSEDDLLAQGHLFLPLGEVLGRRAITVQLREERKRQGLTLRELTERTGIDEPALSRLETGKNANPTLDTLDCIASALGKVLTCELRDKQPTTVTEPSLPGRIPTSVAVTSSPAPTSPPDSSTA
jgi:DNA-binding Xre family transcriptional regulator